MVGAINRYGSDLSRPWREIEMARLLFDVMIYPRVKASNSLRVIA